MEDGYSCFLGKPNLIHADIGRLLEYYKNNAIRGVCLKSPFPKTAPTPTIHELEIESSQVKLLDKIGEGNFGHVHKGLLNGFDVAVKTLRTKTGTNENVENPKEMLRKEADKMRRLFHPNLCLLICVALDSEPALMILEYMNKGSLEDCVKNDEFVRQEINLNFVLLCLKEIACGMKYLSQQNPPIVHRDLRAANVLVHDENKHLDFKITDFGLTEILHGRSNSFKQTEEIVLPICWLPPEALIDKTYSVKSDVWAFGVLAFEVFTLGANPGVFLGPDKKSNIKNGKTLTFDNCIQGRRSVKDFGRELCPESLFDEIKICWKFKPEERPTFHALHESLIDYDTHDKAGQYS